ncbi:hypothetical protein [Streptomyces albireticuli]|uniref:Uncharacterized protein n=1 Tax=Streptomyces albireticuli TaxID=1940 RepID=A0A2A2D3A7_9ACTN|nr:hypothetical protein [Streptomyces albireticuli]MCD9142889.1 hypothetical protein [Streptomyces albireticuli]MCD9162792.1 hypothetical protein [Streptomyces albireticuli]MCD9192352.1 hypothetical protein [Streptomyces albireticuli]PAU45906.1 hypothetical protein CK936_27060 [Streptomyces albireticuli]
MYALTRLGRVAVAAGAALVLVTGLSTSAQAATGPFDYVSVTHGDLTLDDPDNDVCFLLPGGALRATNGTNTRATLYAEPGDCESQVVGTLQPGMARNFEGGTLPRAVQFG